MRYFIIILMLASCRTSPAPKPIIIHDTVKITNTVFDTIYFSKCDSLQKVFNIQRKELKKRRFQVTKAKYYLALIDKKHSKVVYIKGWLNNRAFNE